MFSLPMSLTIGDSSTVYNTYRKERSEVGKIKSIVVNPSKPANESFGPLNSNSIGSPYVDPGKYDLRSNVTSRSNSTVAH